MRRGFRTSRRAFKEVQMVKRMILMLTVTAGILTGLGFVKYRQVREAIAQGASFRPPPESVTTILTTREKWPEVLKAIGTVTALQGVVVSADLPGIVDRIEFDSGGAVSEGSVLVRLDTRQEQAQLAAAEAARDLAGLNFNRLQGLADQSAISRVDYDRAAADQKQAEAKVEEIRAIIARKTICAPFSGILGIRQVNLGQYLSGGEAIVSLQKFDPIYVEFALPQQFIGKVHPGSPIRVESDALGNAGFSGQVTALNSIVDEATRNIQIQATLANPQGRLRPGMFVQTVISLGAGPSVIPLPAPAISYAPYGDSVFILADIKGTDGQTFRGVQQRFVKLGPARGDQIAVLSGLKPGEEVVTSGVFKLRSGTAVLVNNKVRPSNERHPKPEDQ
jgi:membrane fusion protein, multidrug efflux system